MEDEYLEKLDLYEVDKRDYRSYEYRCKNRLTMKVRPQEGLCIYKDIKTGEWLYGISEEIVMEMPAHRYFIFYFLPDEELGPHLGYKEIQLSDEEYMEFLKTLLKQKGATNGEEN